MTIHSSLPESLSGQAVRLSDNPNILGVAWRRPTAAEVVSHLCAEGLAISGITLYEEQGGRLELAMAFWTCNPEPNEDYAGYVRRSCEGAHGYIVSLQDVAGENVLYEVVDCPRSQWEVSPWRNS